MPFGNRSVMEQKLEFVRLASAAGANVSALCRRFGIGRTLAHKLIARYRAEGDAGLAERSRQPRSSPGAALPEVEAAALSVRAANPAWGGRKIALVLFAQGAVHSVALDGDRHLASQRDRARVAGRRGKALHPLRARSPQRSVADGLQGPCRPAHRPAASAHRARRPFALLDRAVGLRRPDHRNRANAPDRGLPPLRSAVAHRHRQRPAMGRWRPQQLHAAHRLADRGQRRRQPLQAVPPADARQGGALPPDAQGRGAAGTTLRRSRQGPGRLRPLAPCLQCRAATRSASPTPCRSIAIASRSASIAKPSNRSTTPPAISSAASSSKGFVSVLGRSIRLCKAFAGKSVAFRPAATDGVFDAWFRHQKIETIDLNALAR